MFGKLKAFLTKEEPSIILPFGSNTIAQNKEVTDSMNETNSEEQIDFSNLIDYDYVEYLFNIRNILKGETPDTHRLLEISFIDFLVDEGYISEQQHLILNHIRSAISSDSLVNRWEKYVNFHLDKREWENTSTLLTTKDIVTQFEDRKFGIWNNIDKRYVHYIFNQLRAGKWHDDVMICEYERVDFTYMKGFISSEERNLRRIIISSAFIKEDKEDYVKFEEYISSHMPS
ncbi:hypothetical protein [Paenisporosarcina sp. NPDC076898]|uniref:hypothetical protein n=1 Tax=unclassified Paenisporosarcina TaxID=2642018 RepID=UPI003D059B8C